MNGYVLVLIIIVLGMLIGLLFGLMFTYYSLLKRLALKYPEYYRKLGSPFLPTASRSIGKTIGRDKFNYRLLGNLLNGSPNDYPDEVRLQRLARYVRIEMFAIIGLFFVGVGLAISALAFS